MMKTEATVSQPTAPAGSPLMQVSGALIGIIALILAAAWVIKRMGFAPKGNSVRGLKVSASASLGPRERVVIVEVENAAPGTGRDRLADQPAAHPAARGE
ncbi:flagellar biosynthesis protein FliO [Salmonella enterica subsp. enterica serovar Typhimurium]|nr:flagellar biosynthesis protein FliO [Salmonella enterica subsp. enterica serovar Typhimurium]